jgi:hypothetical protein
MLRVRGGRVTGVLTRVRRLEPQNERCKEEVC